MNLFETQFQDIQQVLFFEDHSLVIRRIIDLTLDTEEVSFYKKTSDLLTWLDYNKSNTEEIKIRFSDILFELYQFLSIREEKKYTPLMEVKGLKKAYSQSSFALGPIDLKISEGEIVGLVGENGNGKTTLLRSLCKELKPTYGEIQYHFEYKDEYDLRSRLIYIPQRTDTWHGAMLDNLKFTAASYGIKGEKNELITDLVVTRMGLREYKNLRWKNLSSGYKMRFELARMLLRKPKLLVIDEPLANLDILDQQTVLDDFKAIAKSPFRPLGIVLSSQQLYEVEKTSDQVVFLKLGQQKNLTTRQDKFQIVSETFIVEFESDWTQEELFKVFFNLQIIKIHQNGGTYIAVFPAQITMNAFLQVIIEKGVPLKYFRNISNSTRRFFI